MLLSCKMSQSWNSVFSAIFYKECPHKSDIPINFTASTQRDQPRILIVFFYVVSLSRCVDFFSFLLFLSPLFTLRPEGIRELDNRLPQTHTWLVRQPTERFARNGKTEDRWVLREVLERSSIVWWTCPEVPPQAIRSVVVDVHDAITRL